jgi:hypothetical protein
MAVSNGVLAHQHAPPLPGLLPREPGANLFVRLVADGDR